MNPYSSSLLNDLHHHFPALLYESDRFQTVQDVLMYIRERAQENPYDRERRRYLSRQEEKQEAEPYLFQRSSSAYAVSQSDEHASSPSSVSVSAPVPPPAPAPAPAQAAQTHHPIDLLQQLMRHRRTRPSLASLASSVPSSSTSPASSRFRVSFPLDVNSLFASEYSAPAPPALQGLSILQELLQPVIVRPTEQHLAENTYVYCSEVAHNENCSICQDPMEAGQETRTLLACGHCFHRVCIDRWFQENVRCPTCRRDVRERS